MKGKMLILFAVICSFTACVKEELIGPSGGEDITITASLMTEVIRSKALEAGSSEEKTMNNAVVLVFPQTSTGTVADDAVCIGAAEAQKGENTEMLTAKVKTKIGNVRFIAVANAEAALLARLKGAQTSKMTYSSLKTEITKQQLAVPENLVKVGEKSASLTNVANGGITSTPPIEITLYQIPARVVVTVSLKNESSGWTFDLVEGATVVGVSPQSPLILKSYDENNPSQYGFAVNPVSTSAQFTLRDKVLSFYTYEKNTADAPVVLTIPVKAAKGALTRELTYTLNLDPKAGGLSKTNGIIHGYYYDVQATIDPKDPEMNLTVTVASWIIKEVDVNYGN